jgi:citrate lyase subunit beta/citryl-CoA lyase
MAIPPKQLGPILATFQPTSEEIERAQEIVDAYEDALSRGEGAIQVKGKFIDEPVYKRALSILGKR